jgi:hypothetical protein
MATAALSGQPVSPSGRDADQTGRYTQSMKRCALGRGREHHGHLVAVPLAGGKASVICQRTEEPFGWVVLGVDQFDADLVEGDVRDGLEPGGDGDGAHQ